MKNPLIIPRCLLIVTAQLGLLRADASVTNLPRVVKVDSGTPLRQLAEKELGDKEAAAELMHFNRITRPGELEPGTELLLPGKSRALALAALDGAEQRLVAAAASQAPKFAADAYNLAARNLDQARRARLEARYDQTALLARVAAVQADEAARLARRNAVVNDPATVVVISGPGKVELSADGVNNWVPAKVGDSMLPGMWLRTGEDTRAEVRLGDGSSLRVAPGTVMELPENTVDLRDTSQRTTRIKVLLGDILGEITPRKNATNSTFRIQAGKTAISIRGTTLLVGAKPVGANQDAETRVSMHEGRADVSKAEVRKELEKDFGLLVKPNERMRDPENLPPPPALVWPQEKDEVTKLQQPVIRWAAPAPIPASVRVRVSRDDRFNDIVHDQVAKGQREGSSVVARVLPAGKYFARLSALTASGLEGAPTAALAFEVRPDLGLRFQPNPAAFMENGVHFAVPGFTPNPEVGPGNRVQAQLEQKVGAGWQTVAEPKGVAPGGAQQDGHYRVTARAVGPDNAVGPEQRLEYVIDGTAPRLSLQSSQPEAGRDITLVAVTATDENGVGKVEYRLNQGEWQPYTGPVRVTHLDDTRFQARATDRLGNATQTMTLELPGSRVRR